MKKYLREDVTGAYSRIEYGKQGEQVEVISHYNGFVLVEGKEGKFHVREGMLSEDKIPKAKVK